jgi:hypothetical protein
MRRKAQKAIWTTIRNEKPKQRPQGRTSDAKGKREKKESRTDIKAAHHRKAKSDSAGSKEAKAPT